MLNPFAFHRGLWLLGCWLPLAQACVIDTASSSLPEYDPLQAGDSLWSLNWSLRSLGQNCSGDLGLQASAAGTLPGQVVLWPGGGPTGLVAQLSSESTGQGPALWWPQIWRSVVGPSDPSTPLPLTLWWRLPAGQWPPAGNYPVSLRAMLWRSDGQLITEQTVVLNQSVRPRVDLNLVGGTGRLDFGTLGSGQRRSVDVQVRHNTPYLLRLQSQNGGRLQNSQWPQAHIAYRLWIDQQELPLASGPVPLQRLASALASHRIEVEIQSVDNPPAGNYGDDVLITVEAL